MPTYVYTCTECGQQLEAVQKFSDEPLRICPNCQGALRKVFTPVGVVFKGSGFYKTDSRDKKSSSSSPAPAATTSSSSDSSSGSSSASSSSSSSSSDSGGGSSSTPSTSSSSSSESKPATKPDSGNKVA